jgi:hypothetical protein
MGETLEELMYMQSTTVVTGPVVFHHCHQYHQYLIVTRRVAIILGASCRLLHFRSVVSNKLSVTGDAYRKHDHWNEAYINSQDVFHNREILYKLMSKRKRSILNKLLAIRAFMDKVTNPLSLTIYMIYPHL